MMMMIEKNRHQAVSLFDDDVYKTAVRVGTRCCDYYIIKRCQKQTLSKHQ